jgi:hypothetical protein
MSCETILDDPLLREIYAYWQLKRAERRMPARRQIDPCDVPRLLPHLIISEVVDTGRSFRYRLAGTAIATALGQDVTGRCVDEVTSGVYRDYINGLHRAVCTERRPVFAAGSLACATSAKYRFTRRLLLPLSDDDSVVNQILSLVVFHFALGAPALTVLDLPAAAAS